MKYFLLPLLIPLFAQGQLVFEKQLPVRPGDYENKILAASQLSDGSLGVFEKSSFMGYTWGGGYVLFGVGNVFHLSKNGNVMQRFYSESYYPVFDEDYLYWIYDDKTLIKTDLSGDTLLNHKYTAYDSLQINSIVMSTDKHLILNEYYKDFTNREYRYYLQKLDTNGNSVLLKGIGAIDYNH